jgi:hypothetical protein
MEKEHIPNQYVCDECGVSKKKSEMIISLYTFGVYCYNCLKNDEEINCHKWESL